MRKQGKLHQGMEGSRAGGKPSPAAAGHAQSSTSSDDLAEMAFVGDIHDALGDIVLARTGDGTIVSANATFKRMTGCRTPVGRTCEQLGIRFLPREKPHCYDVVFGEGEDARIFLWHDVMTGDADHPAFIRSIARDVTAERREARQKEAERQKAEADSEMKSRLIATVSHEIRTPLAGLLGMGNLLAATKLSAEQRNYLEGIRQSGTALVQLVEDLLDFSTLAAGRFSLRPREEAIRPLIEGVVELLSSRAHAKGIEIGSTVSPDLPERLVLDPARFRQVLYNVIGNAVKFTEEGGILVSAHLDCGRLVVRVTDTGPGMNEREVKRIFNEFEQGDLSRGREGGVGLGLAISASIMAQSGGSLSVESVLGKGSIFTIELPVEGAGGAMRSGRELAGARVLLFAPDGPAATGLSSTLRALGAETHSATSLEQATRLLDTVSGLTGIIVDHRFDSLFCEELSNDSRLAGARRAYLVSPESRPARMSGDHYDCWLIRPLREQSLIDVLTGKLKGLERRPASSKAFPSLAAEPEEEVETQAPKPAAPLSILVGEDDPVNAMLVRAVLVKAGHDVRVAGNFTDLANLLSDERADLLITDNEMPDGTAAAFLERLNSSDSAETAAVPVIVLTANNSTDIHRGLIESGAKKVLVKPVGPEHLLAAISETADAARGVA